MNEYGEGLRRLIAAGRNLERWIDFKAYQVFEESTTYTALQFFTKAPNDAILVADAPTGEIPQDPWADAGYALAYGREAFGERWLLLTGKERALIDRLYQRCKRLDDPAHTSSIFVGIQTSADAIYHLRRLGPGHYLCTPKGDNAQPPYEVEIEDALMKPLVSGAEARRYIAPETNTYLLFPYQVSRKGVKLIDAATMQGSYPKAWAYLRSYEGVLRARENNRMDYDAGWWGYNYPKNLDKQEIVKLIVAQTVPEMRVCLDESASMYLNNVRVNGIIAADNEEPWFLLGALNSRVTGFVFRRIAKVKSGGFFEANKQFIAPLPIPPATVEERKTVAAKARALQAAHTARRNTLAKIARRLAIGRTRSKPLTWLFPSLKPERDLISDAPARLGADKKIQWAEKRYALDLAALYDAITARLFPGCSLAAAFRDGELSFSIDGVPVIDRIFVDADDGEFIVAQWKVLAATFVITEKTDGKKLADALRKLAIRDNPALVQQIIALEGELSALELDIARQEDEMDAIINGLYELSNAEMVLIGKEMRSISTWPALTPAPAVCI
jgi:hypothetical protein